MNVLSGEKKSPDKLVRVLLYLNTINKCIAALEVCSWCIIYYMYPGLDAMPIVMRNARFVLFMETNDRNVLLPSALVRTIYIYIRVHACFVYAF